MKPIFFSIFACLLFSTTFASDHIDGVPSKKHPHTDLTDLYAFKSGDKLSLILNVYPGASRKAHLSDKVNYRITIRPVSADYQKSLFDVNSNQDSEMIILCTAYNQHHHHNAFGSGSDEKTATCSLKSPLKTVTLKTQWNDEAGVELEGNRFFAGRRLDPFFFSIENFRTVTGREEFVTVSTDYSNGMDTASLLSLILEFDPKDFFPEGKTLLGIAAESYRRIDQKVIDRVGRPEITNLSLHRFSSDDLPLKEYYNQQLKAFTPFQHPEDYEVYSTRLIENISAYDSLNLDRKDWQEDSMKNLVDLLLMDFLVINTSPDCTNSDHNFFTIEKALLKGDSVTAESACGGRKLTDNAMSVLYALYMGGLDAQVASYEDNVLEPYYGSDSKVFDSFPYLTKAPKRMSGTTTLLMGFLKNMQDGVPWTDTYKGPQSKTAE